MKTMILNIKGRDWTINFVTEKEYFKKVPDAMESDEAATLSTSKTIYFIKNKISTSAIYHELLHALVSECALASSGLDSGQVEENCCELIGDHFEDIFQWGHKIINFYMKEA